MTVAGWSTEEMSIAEGPSLGHGPLLSVRFADGREFAVTRTPGMNFGVRWRDAVPGQGRIHLRRNRAARTWRPMIGWQRGSVVSYIHTGREFASWRDALQFSLLVLRDWIEADDMRAYQSSWYGPRDARIVRALGSMHAMFGEPASTQMTEPDR